MTADGLDTADLAERLGRHEPSVASDLARVQIARGPGRVNLIGEHTDYNDGLVLPAAIDLEVRIAFVPTTDRIVRITLAATGERGEFALDAIPPASGQWIDYVAATAWSLGAAGLAIHGFRGILASSLPIGAGLSSSAALELAAAWALLDPPALAAHGIDRVRLATLCRKAEHDHVGVRCGIMDQFAASLGERGRALFLDCRSLAYRAIPLPADHALVVCDTGVRRALDASAYNDRRAECEAAVATIAEQEPEVRSLRDVDLAMLARHSARLDPVELARAEHVVRENGRVERTVDALEAGDLDAVGRMFAQSHASLRDRFEVSSPELDALVEITSGVPGVVGSRMTGAGFGGCTVSLVQRDAVDAVRVAVERDGPSRTGHPASVFVVDAAEGAGLVLPPPTGG